MRQGLDARVGITTLEAVSLLFTFIVNIFSFGLLCWASLYVCLIVLDVNHVLHCAIQQS